MYRVSLAIVRIALAQNLTEDQLDSRIISRV